MPMDIDYVAATQALDNIKTILDKQPHMEREKIADEIIEFQLKLEKKYKT